MLFLRGLVVVLVALCGCTNVTSSDAGVGGGAASTGGGKAGTGGGGAVSTGGGTGATGGGTTATGGGASGGPSFTGTIKLTRGPLDGGDTTSQVSSRFLESSAASVAYERCHELAKSGDCAVYACDPSDGGEGTPTVHSAGTITIASATLDGGSVEAPPSFSNSYFYDNDPFWTAPGQTITVSATAGGDLPAFGPVTITSPEDGSLMSPNCRQLSDAGVSGECGSYARDSALPLSWSGGAGSASAALEFVDVPNNAFALVCSFDAGASSSSIAPALLSKLPAGQYLLLFESEAQKVVKVGEYSITISAAYTGDFAGHLGSITFQ